MRVFSKTLLDEVAEKAAATVRGRAHFNVHDGPLDLLQRFFVVAQSRTYFRPHRHRTKSEMALVLRGSFDVLTFDDMGIVSGRWAIGGESMDFAYETPMLIWHTLLACEDGSAFLEFKEGPYDPATAAEFAAWAPAEGDAGASAYQAWLRGAQVGERFAPGASAL